MAAPPSELEGTWEEIAAHGPELSGRRVRLIVLPDEENEPIRMCRRKPVHRPQPRCCGTREPGWAMTYRNVLMMCTPTAPNPGSDRVPARHEPLQPYH